MAPAYKSGTNGIVVFSDKRAAVVVVAAAWLHSWFPLHSSRLLLIRHKHLATIISDLATNQYCPSYILQHLRDTHEEGMASPAIQKRCKSTEILGKEFLKSESFSKCGHLKQNGVRIAHGAHWSDEVNKSIHMSRTGVKCVLKLLSWDYCSHK